MLQTHLCIGISVWSLWIDIHRFGFDSSFPSGWWGWRTDQHITHRSVKNFLPLLCGILITVAYMKIYGFPLKKDSIFYKIHGFHHVYIYVGVGIRSNSFGRYDPPFLYERMLLVSMICICEYIYGCRILLSLRR